MPIKHQAELGCRALEISITSDSRVLVCSIPSLVLRQLILWAVTLTVCP